MSIEIIEDADDQARRHTWEYLNGLLPHGDMHPVFSTAEEQDVVQTISGVFRAVDADETVGAAYIGPCWEEAGDALKGGADRVADGILRFVRALQGIAVNQDRRSEGIGATLLAAAEARAVAEGMWVIIGVAHGAPELVTFYERHGYTVGEPARPLLLRVRDDSMVLPQADADSRWFCKLLPHPSSGDVQASAFHPTDRQIELLAAGADTVLGHP